MPLTKTGFDFLELIAKASPVRQLLTFLDQIGVDEKTLRVGHIDPRLRNSSDPIRVSAGLIIELMEAAAEKSDNPELGIQFADWLNPRGFDTLGLLWEQSASLAECYTLVQRYVHLENNALQYSLTRGQHEVALIHDVVSILKARSTQFMASFLALTVRVCRIIFGSSWNPVRVEFSTARPRQIQAHRHFFRCDLRFGRDRNAVIVSVEDFERQLPNANAEMVAFICRNLEQQSLDWSAEIKDLVEQIISSEIAGKAPTLAQVATKLAMSPRTLQRRLMQHGTDFGAVLKSVRKEIVTDRLTQSSPPTLAQLAFDLGFSESSAASRFIRTELGYSLRDKARAIKSGTAISPQKTSTDKKPIS